METIGTFSFLLRSLSILCTFGQNTREVKHDGSGFYRTLVSDLVLKLSALNYFAVLAQHFARQAAHYNLCFS